jgi:hypothetical protein
MIFIFGEISLHITPKLRIQIRILENFTDKGFLWLYKKSPLSLGPSLTI